MDLKAGFFEHHFDAADVVRGVIDDEDSPVFSAQQSDNIEKLNLKTPLLELHHIHS